MAKGWASRTLCAVVLAGMTGCSLFVDASDIDAGCAETHKLCPGVGCVAINDPAYGCTPDGCAPCSLTQALSECDGDVCVVESCLFPFDCRTVTGCPINVLFDRENCGQCENACAEGEVCLDGRCAL